ncbi:MAG: cation:dicarboxylase symporter family transporter, partial [Lachnospiraceae bacterium]|nr:cation:dicarboxylase symporter family transporter [Lachnospiraceae bacterium]
MTYREHILNGTAVETISNEVQEYLTGLNTESQSKQRMRLTIEELLLSVMDHGGTVVKVGIGKQFGRHVFHLKYEMEPYDPTKGAEDEWVGNMMRSLGFFPSWSCYGRRNTVSLILADRPKRSMLFYIVLAVIASVLLGFLGDGIPSSLREEIRNALLLPIANGFLGLLKTFSGIMICLAICNGILGTGDTTTLGHTGKSVITRFIVISFLISVLSVVIVFPFLSLRFSTGAQGRASAVNQISKMLFDILPSNLMEPFQTGNTLQIIVIAIIIGVGLLAIGERGKHVRILLEESFALMQHIVSAICALIPIFVFAVILNQIWSGHEMKFLSILKPLTRL